MSPLRSGRAARAQAPLRGEEVRNGGHAGHEHHEHHEGGPGLNPWLEDRLAHLGVDGPVLDFGCGRGYWLDHMKAAGLTPRGGWPAPPRVGDPRPPRRQRAGPSGRRDGDRDHGVPFASRGPAPARA